MKDLNVYLKEELKLNKRKNVVRESSETIKSESDFKDYAKNKFKTVFGDKLDEDKMKKVIDGLLKKYSKEAKDGDWGTLVGALNKSF